MGDQNEQAVLAENTSKHPEEKPMTLSEIFGVVKNGRKLLAICTALGLVFGVVSVYMFYRLQSRPVTGEWTMTYGLSDPAAVRRLGVGVSPLDVRNIDTARLEEAMATSGLDQLGYTAAEIASRLTGQYASERYTLTFQAEGALVSAENEVAAFLKALPALAFEQNQQAVREKLTAITETEDYPLAIFKISQAYNADWSTPVFDEQLIAIRREIDSTKATKNRDELLERLRSDIAYTQVLYDVASVEAQIQTAMLDATHVDLQADELSERNGELRLRAQNAISQASIILKRLTYYEYLVKNYSEGTESTVVSPHVETMFSELIDDIVASSLSVGEPALETIPRITATVPRVALILISVVFMGVFVGLILIFGKRFVLGNAAQQGRRSA